MNFTDMVQNGFEPSVADTMRRAGDFNGVCLASIAVSLKRIADAVTGEGPNILTASINSYGEGIGDAIQGQLVRGQAGISQYDRR